MDDNLDPGIKEVVRYLGQHNFHTTDSGDGISKPAQGWTEEDGVLEIPHVFITCELPMKLVPEAERLAHLLDHIGIVLSPIGEGVHIQATYDPANNTATIGLFGLNDEMLHTALKEPE